MIATTRDRIGITSLAVALLALGLTSGCGGSGGPTRYSLEGAVTFDGQPIPTGEIRFEPDTSQDNSGPAGHAIIEDGRYVTSSGKGTVGGPHIVRIEGLDGKASGEMPYGNPLFEDYKVILDLPKEDTSHDFDVPATQP